MRNLLLGPTKSLMFTGPPNETSAGNEAVGFVGLNYLSLEHLQSRYNLDARQVYKVLEMRLKIPQIFGNKVLRIKKPEAISHDAGHHNYSDSWAVDLYAAENLTKADIEKLKRVKLRFLQFRSITRTTTGLLGQ